MSLVRLALLVLLTLPVLAQNEPSLITVTGQAEVLVVPDRVQVSLQAVTRHRDAQAAERANAAVVQKILGVSRAFNIKPDDIQTSNLELNEVTEEFGQKLTGYVAIRSISLSLREPGRTDDLVGALVRAGGNRIVSVSLETSDLLKYREQARIEAVKAARRKAEQMAQGLGQSVGPAHTVTEEPEETHSGAIMSQVRSRATGEAAPSEAWGRLSVRANVTIAFQLRPQALSSDSSGTSHSEGYSR